MLYFTDERAYAAMGVHAFSVFEIPNHDYQELATLEPILITRPKVLEASGPGLVAAGFTLLPTGRFPHWSVVVSEPTSTQFDRVRALHPMDRLTTRFGLAGKG